MLPLLRLVRVRRTWGSMAGLVWCPCHWRRKGSNGHVGYLGLRRFRGEAAGGAWACVAGAGWCDAVSDGGHSGS